MISISMTVDGRPLSAQVSLGTTLRSFLETAGGASQELGVLSDGQRAISSELELAVRWQGASLVTAVSEKHLAEVAALTPEQLLVAVEKS